MAIDKRPVDIYSSRSGINVTPSDTVDLVSVTRRIVSKGSGTIAVILVDDIDTNILVFPVVAGTTLNIRARRIMDTDTNVDVIALF